jgi:ATPase family protein associated with various cellular activities (AAA)
MTPQTNVFAGLQAGAESHFRLFYYAAVLRLTRYVRRLARTDGTSAGELVRPFKFLKGYEDELSAYVPEGLGEQESRAWWREQTRAWEESVGVRLPLRELTRRQSLSHGEQTALVLAGLVEEDIRFGSLFAALQEPLPSRRPCLGLLGALAFDTEDGADWWSALRRLIEMGLFVAENQSAPRSEWIVRVPQQVWDALRGRKVEALGEGCRLYSRREFPPLKRLTLDDALMQRARGLPAVIARGQLSAVVLRGMADSGRRTVMGSLARSMRRDLLFYDRTAPHAEDVWQLVGLLATLTGALPVVCLDPAPGETVELPALKGYEGAVGVVMRREGGVGGPLLERAVTLNLPAPAPAHRREVWESVLAGRAGEDLPSIVERFLLPLGNLSRAAGIAAGYAALERREQVTAADVQLACRTLNRQKLDTLAQRLEVGGGWGDLVVNDSTVSQLEELEQRCRHRERLLGHLGRGFNNSANCGVRALFNGPSGTGKTLAAKILAAVLQTDVYRVDLASVVNKYIGETEKNLSQLLARAEELDVILLIDEGDSLMTSRTDVKSANDRYANLETNYLLQRIETYQGIVVVTTNAGNRIDQAFQRRFDVSVHFYPPDAAERLSIWRLHLPATHRVSEARLQEAARNWALTGGQIRNAALHATLLAVEAGRGDFVEESDFEAAVQREYRKAGASFPIQRPPGRNGNGGHGHYAALSQFLADIG